MLMDVCVGITGKLGVRGVLRDHNEDWKGCFIAKIPIETVAMTEGWAILRGIS